MRNIWLVLKHEFKTTVSQPSFWVLTFVMPLFLMGLNSFSLMQELDIPAQTGEATTDGDTSANATPPPARFRIGLVDEGKVIVEFPPDFPADFFIPFPDQASARTALEADEIDQFVYIPSDYLTTGDITVYDKDFQIMTTGQMGVGFDSADESILAYLINYNLTRDPALILVLQNPTPGHLVNSHIVRPPVETNANDGAMAQLVASMMPFMFYFLLVLSSNYLMRSVVAEKENRTAELLLLSLPPRELMMGKILGLGVVTFLQLLVWLGGGYLILNRGAAYMDVSAFTFPPGFFVWALIFLILGYLLFGSIMAAAGAIAQNARESGQTIWILIIPLMPTLMFGSEMLENPNGGLAMGLSLFPLSAPSAMVTRLAIAPVPAWQLAASLILLGLTTYVFINLSARFFRSGNLLSQEAFNWRRFVTAWRE